MALAFTTPVLDNKVSASPETDVEGWLLEQLEAIADELFSRVYRTAQRPWTQADCPWHRRLAEIGFSDAPCPVCTQIGRSRRAPLRAMEGRNAAR